MPDGERSSGGTAEGRVNGGGGLSSAELSAGADLRDGGRSVALAEAPVAGDVLTLLEAERVSVAQASSDALLFTSPTAPTSSASPTPSTSEADTARHAAPQQLMALARRFAEAEPEEAHDLFTTTFGLYGARHFGIAPDPASAERAEVSWWHGPTVRQPRVPVLSGLLPRARRARRRTGEAAGGGAAVDRANVGRHRKPQLVDGGPELSAEQRRDAALTAERRAAARMLLAHPLVTATGPHAEALPLIRRHAGWLAGRFDELLGYPLVVTETFARLRKSGIGPGSLRRLEIDGGACPPEVYAALALALAVLLTGPRRRPAGQLAAGLVTALDEAGFRSPDEEPAEPASKAIEDALSLLKEWQVIADPGAEGWLTVDQELVAALSVDLRLGDLRLGEPGPAVAAGPDEHLGDAEMSVPVAVRRQLAETPVVLFDDLTALEREWLRESRHREAEAFADFLGLTAELRSEGIALLDPAGELTDLRLPDGDGPAQAALLLVERLVEQLRPLPPETSDSEPGLRGDTSVAGVSIPEALIDGILGDVADEYGTAAHWCRDQLADRAAFRRDVLSLLHRMGLIAPAGRPLGRKGVASRGRAPGGWLLLAPAARYAPQAELRPTPGNGRHSRRGEQA